MPDFRTSFEEARRAASQPTFYGHIELLLEKWIEKNDKDAVNTAAILFFSDDPVLVETAASVGERQYENLGRLLVKSTIDRIQKKTVETTSQAGEARVSQVLGMTRFSNNGRDYLRLCVLCLDSGSPSVRSLAIWALRNSRPYLQPILGNSGRSLSWPRLTDSQENLSEIKKVWARWVEGGDKDGIDAAMIRYFRDERGKVLRAFSATTQGASTAPLERD
jgi:superfamily I DNA/RNA helicase